MRYCLALSCFVFASLAYAENIPSPPVLTPVDAFLVESFEGCKHIDFHPGQVLDCEYTSAPSHGSSLWTCRADEAYANLRCQNGEPLRLEFRSVLIQRLTDNNRFILNFRYIGPYQGPSELIPEGAKVKLGFWYFDNEPGSIRGSFELPEFNVNKALVGKPASH